MNGIEFGSKWAICIRYLSYLRRQGKYNTELLSRYIIIQYVIMVWENEFFNFFMGEEEKRIKKMSFFYVE